MSRVIGRMFEAIAGAVLVCIVVCFAVFLALMRTLFIPIFSLIALKICVIGHFIIAACVGLIGGVLLGREDFSTIVVSSLCVTASLHLFLSATVIFVFIRQQCRRTRYFFEPPWYRQLETLFYTLAWQFFFPITYASDLSSGRIIRLA